MKQKVYFIGLGDEPNVKNSISISIKVKGKFTDYSKFDLEGSLDTFKEAIRLINVHIMHFEDELNAIEERECEQREREQKETPRQLDMLKKGCELIINHDMSNQLEPTIDAFASEDLKHFDHMAYLDEESNLISEPTDYEKLKKIMANCPELIFDNRGYQYLPKEILKKYATECNVVKEIIERRLDQKGSIEFNNFKPRKDGTFALRFQGRYDNSFFGVYYTDLEDFKTKEEQ